jgi:hypothetical protein
MSANSAVLSKDQRKLRIPKITPPGEVWLFVDVAQVTSHTPEQIAQMAESLGYAPELRIAEYFRDGHSTLKPVLLIHHGMLTGEEGLASEKLLNDWEELSIEIQPPISVHLRSGQKP